MRAAFPPSSVPSLHLRSINSKKISCKIPFSILWKKSISEKFPFPQKDFPFYARLMLRKVAHSAKWNLFVPLHPRKNAHKNRIEREKLHNQECFLVLEGVAEKKKNVISLTNNRGAPDGGVKLKPGRRTDGGGGERGGFGMNGKPNGTVGTCDALWISKQSRFSICFPFTGLRRGRFGW